MKYILIKFIGIIFKPLQWFPHFFLKFKDIAFLYPAEHLQRTVDFIKNNYPDINKENAYIIDIGCADGGTSKYFARKFPKCKVIGYEPELSSYNKAVKLCKKSANVSIKNVALAKNSGSASLNITANHLSSSLNKLNEPEITKEDKIQQERFKIIETQIVNTKNLDDETAAISGILLIKMDTQGTELDILQGAAETLKKTRFILIELNNHHLYENTCQYYEIDALLREKRFKLMDMIVTYRSQGMVTEYDALYQNMNYDNNCQ